MLNNSTVSYIAKLLKSEETTIKKLTELEEDRIELVRHASKKRLNKKTLKKIPSKWRHSFCEPLQCSPLLTYLT